MFYYEICFTYLNCNALLFREKDVFYYEMEFRRLEWKKSRVEASRGVMGGRSKELERAQQALDVSAMCAGWGESETALSPHGLLHYIYTQVYSLHSCSQLEQRGLAQQLKWNFSDDDRDRLMRVGGREGKDRRYP